LSPDTEHTLFDVGANVGQSVTKFVHLWPKARIYSFEPSPTTFTHLTAAHGAKPNVTLINAGVGSEPGSLSLRESTTSVMSSFLAVDQRAWGEVYKETSVPVVTVDQFCAERDISSIAFLKIDTQGFDHQVLLGAQKMIASGQVRFLQIEAIFDDLYSGVVRFDKTYGLLADWGFAPLGYFSQSERNDVLSFCDVLFEKRP
jgi:FkbM family methyltransferase